MEDFSKPRPLLDFSPERDLNFLVYHLLIFLNQVKATPEKPLKDQRALPLLLTLIADPVLISIIERQADPLRLHSRDHTRLLLAESRAKRARSRLSRMVFALRKRDILALTHNRSGDKNFVSVGLQESDDVSALLALEIFEPEHGNTRRLKKILPRLKSMNAESIYQRLLGDRGVNSWI